MSSEPLQFDDAALKAALARAVGAERAPQGLRERIERLVACEQAVSPRVRPWRNVLYGLAAAAVLLIAFAGVAYRLVFSATKVYAEVNVAMVAKHDHCCAGAGTRGGMSG